MKIQKLGKGKHQYNNFSKYSQKRVYILLRYRIIIEIRFFSFFVSYNFRFSAVAAIKAAPLPLPSSAGTRSHSTTAGGTISFNLSFNIS